MPDMNTLREAGIVASILIIGGLMYIGILVAVLLYYVIFYAAKWFSK
jgi:hypothetical protein